MIPVYIISLPEAEKRRKRITNIMNDLGLDFEFFDAIDGRQFDVIHHPNYDAKKRLRSFGKHLTGGEIGCLLSHKKIYERIVRLNAPHTLVLEDDIIINDGFLETLYELLKHPVPFDAVRFLDSPKLERLKLRPVHKLKFGHTLTRHTGMPGGAHATLITKAGAQKILKHLDKTPYPIDALMGRSWMTGLDWYTIRPGLVAQDRDIESMIGDDARFDSKQDITGMTKTLFPITRAWFKFTETIGKKYWYYKMYFKDKKYD